jgi:hypothetical protein
MRGSVGTRRIVFYSKWWRETKDRLALSHFETLSLTYPVPLFRICLHNDRNILHVGFVASLPSADAFITPNARKTKGNFPKP